MVDVKTLSLVDAHAAAYNTSIEADELNNEFMRLLGAKSRNYMARLAMSRSLAIDTPPPALSSSAGKVIKGANLFGEDYRLWVALLVQHAGHTSPAVADLQELARRHWARGMGLLQADWKDSGEDFESFLRVLASKAGIKAEGEAGPGSSTGVGSRGIFSPKAVPVRIPIGEVSLNADTLERVEWYVNGPGTSPHFAVMGTLGSGKTRTAMTMIRAMRKQSGCPVILFDMGKGDLASDKALIADLGATVVDPLKTAIPLDVLHVPSKDPADILNAAMRFRESFARVPSTRLGGAQVDSLRDAATRALTRHRPARIVDVRDRLREVYAEKRRKDDVAIATFNDLTGWNLFEPKMVPTEFFSRSWIIDLHTAPETAQRLVVFLLLDALQAHLTQLGDSDVDSLGNRALRIVIGIDEARKVLGYEHASLIGLVRESRSKGGILAFMSQSPDDFDGEDENFLENLGLGICFRSNGRSSVLNALLGQQVDLAGLPNGICVTRFAGERLVKVRAWEERPK
jgi:DNA sulfur modification protein DndE